MQRVFVHGLGAVSPAGWGVDALCSCVASSQQQIPTKTLARPGWEKPFIIHSVPPPATKPAFLAHPRLRRANLISQFTVAAALEALGADAAHVTDGSLRLGIVMCVMAGSVAYSRRFFEETMRDPATASPLVFPETVFNAPASHLAAYLGCGGINYTIVGDESTFAQGLALAADWLLTGKCDGCLVIGAEEMDWIVSDAVRLFDRQSIHSDGAGAIYLRSSRRACRAEAGRRLKEAQTEFEAEKEQRGKGAEEEKKTCDSEVSFSPQPPFPSAVAQTSPSLGQRVEETEIELASVTDSFLFTKLRSREEATRRVREQLAPAGNEILCDSGTALERKLWSDWSGPRVTLKPLLGEAFSASSAWQCVVACDMLRQGNHRSACVSVVGANQAAIGARFVKSE